MTLQATTPLYNSLDMPMSVFIDALVDGNTDNILDFPKVYVEFCEAVGGRELKQKIEEMEMRLSGGDIALEGDDSDDESAYAPIQWLADSSQEPTARIASAEADALQGPKLDQALMALDERSRNIVQSRWLAMDAEGNGTKTLHDLADEYGISAERVRQIETAALKKMRGLLQAA